MPLLIFWSFPKKISFMFCNFLKKMDPLNIGMNLRENVTYTKVFIFNGFLFSMDFSLKKFFISVSFQLIFYCITLCRKSDNFESFWPPNHKIRFPSSPPPKKNKLQQITVNLIHVGQWLTQFSFILFFIVLFCFLLFLFNSFYLRNTNKILI